MFYTNKLTLLLFVLPYFVTGHYSYAAENTDPTANELIERSKELSRLSKELESEWNNYSRLPRHRYVSTSTTANQPPALQDYLQKWIVKVERIAKQNYPEAARGLQQPISVSSTYRSQQ